MLRAKSAWFVKGTVMLKRLFCKHKDQKFIRNIYGDEINRISTKKIFRSEWKCNECGKTIYHSELVR